MLKLSILLLTVLIIAHAAEIPSSYNLLEKHSTFNPNFNTEPFDKHGTPKDGNKPEHENHPIYRADLHRGDDINDRKGKEPERPRGPVLKHSEMLADQPAVSSTEINRVDNLPPNYGYVPSPMEVAYPDIPYAPGYGYDNGYSSHNYDTYDNQGLTNYLDSDSTLFSLLWSQVPSSRTIVSYVGRTIAWAFNSLFVMMLGSLLTLAVCSYTNLCTITFHGFGPIHEEMRSLITPDRLQKISHAADFVKNAIDKYQKIQKAEEVPKRNRRFVFYQ